MTHLNDQGEAQTKVIIDACFGEVQVRFCCMQGRRRDPAVQTPFVKVPSPAQQPVAILGVNLEVLIHIGVELISVSPSLAWQCGAAAAYSTSQESLWTG